MDERARALDGFPISTGHRFVAIVDLRKADGTSELEELLSMAYRTSCNGPVGLILGSREPAEIDRILDPVVDEVGPHVSGLVYLNPESREDHAELA